MRGLYKIICWHKGQGLFWLRILGRGFYAKEGLSFSERYGYKKVLKFGDWVIGLLA